MMENAKSMKDRMFLLEAENMELRARVSELEGNQNVAPHTQIPVFPTNVTQHRSSGTPLSPMSQQPETPSLQTQEFSPNLPRETGKEPFNETPSLQTQEFSPNLPRELCGIHYVPLYINGNKIEKDFFEYLDNAENNLKEKHVDAAFAMLNQKRIEQSSWFSEQGEVVRGLIHPNKMWMQDVDIVYGVVHERLVDHFIGVEVHLMENTITIFHCGVHKVKENPLIQKLAGLIPAINLEMMNEEINFNDIIPFQVKKAEGLPKTKLPFNCGLFVVKTLE
ncbi:hypothetical protein DY000_02013041 [Brassica cretica]|uniref:Ubiquitin-like protease family profile domain-containing protein n=1 Tax=Brassica cretica TaxID=69181 RepID=A0ABQ7CXT5_BRACR|nr:hypothetical protein DY000_02013041 [Brassica cretica]